MPQIIHSVLLDLDPDDPGAIATAIAGLRSLSTLPGVLSMDAGPNVSPEGLSDGFTHAAVAVFASSEARDFYLTAPEHLLVVELLQRCQHRVTVVDIDGV